jgi:hypothetical protein
LILQEKRAKKIRKGKEKGLERSKQKKEAVKENKTEKSSIRKERGKLIIFLKIRYFFNKCYTKTFGIVNILIVYLLMLL